MRGWGWNWGWSAEARRRKLRLKRAQTALNLVLGFRASGVRPGVGADTAYVLELLDELIRTMEPGAEKDSLREVALTTLDSLEVTIRYMSGQELRQY